MKYHQRIIIIGNSGSGKTWLGRALSENKKIDLFHMDNIRWDQSGYEIRRLATDIEKDLETIKNRDTWILEGVFGKMAQSCLSFADLLIWLDFPWEECKKNLFVRGPQFENVLTSSEKEKALKTLMEWASTHGARKDANSWSFFNNLYTNFECQKICLRSREEIGAFLNKEYEE